MKELTHTQRLFTLLVTTLIILFTLSGCMSSGYIIHPGQDRDRDSWNQWKMYKTIYVMNESNCRVAINNLNGDRYGTVSARSGATLKVPLNPFMDDNDEFKIQVKAVGENPPGCGDGIQFEGFDNNSDPEDLDVDLD